ncbi:hypothetical protein CAG65_09155 [Vibrio sp. V39_P1S14PM300]|nr:hypothetical protein [Vibrio sp. V36_P2S2PM302]NAX21358.1 hypothetical protein [Vibrio sp. V39_P1S14PM300]NAX26154.1 hypothetical protein [Vibrio sp. V38_P2S17PM301]NAX32836.1 hypothetical protein [Vibrio sp. V37_P2S8PM304]
MEFPNFRACSLASLMSAVCGTVSAGMDNLPSSQSYTGALLVPNAQVMDRGDILFKYGQGVPYRQARDDVDELLIGAGLFPGIEASGRIVTKTYDCKGFTEYGCGIRDLSASAKYQLPFVYDWTGLNVAIGVQDLGGAANNFNVYYAVADYELKDYPVRFSGGIGQSDLVDGILDGPFASIEVQPLSFAQIIAEYDSANYNAGIKLFTPEKWLPLDAQLSLQYEAYSNQDSDNQMWSLAAAIPLVGTDSNTLTRLNHDLTLEDKVEVALHQHQSASLTQLRQALINEGFLNVRFSQDDDTLNVSVENRRYNRNQADGLGVAMGIIAAHAGEHLFRDLKLKNPEQGQFNLFMLVNDVPVTQARASAACYRQFLQSGIPCDDLAITDHAVQRQYALAQFHSQADRSSFGRSQVILSPALYHRDATEYGVLDYSLALSTNLYTSLWQGAAIDVRHYAPIANSDDFDDDAIWGDEAFENEIDRALFHQTFNLPYNLMNQTSVGMIRRDYLGIANETQLASPDSRHTFALHLSHFENDKGATTIKRDTVLGSYTLSVPEWNWQLTGQAGEFWQGDQGVKITTRHWLGDVSIDASYLYSEAEHSNEGEQFVTVSIGIPLTFWRGMAPDYVQLRGIDQFTYAVQSRVGDSHNNLNTGLGNAVTFQHDISREYHNRGRSGKLYYAENTQRLRNAYLKYLDTTL